MRYQASTYANELFFFKMIRELNRQPCNVHVEVKDETKGPAFAPP